MSARVKMGSLWTLGGGFMDVGKSISEISLNYYSGRSLRNSGISKLFPNIDWNKLCLTIFLGYLYFLSM